MSEETTLTPEAATSDDAPSEVETDTEEATPAEESDAGTLIVPQPELSHSLSSSQVEPTERKDVPGGRAYEIIYIVRVNAEETPEVSTERVRNFIENSGGAVDNVRISEVRRLAYPIAKQIEGVYVVVNARFVKELTVELDRFFKLDEAILRHMVLREND